MADKAGTNIALNGRARDALHRICALHLQPDHPSRAPRLSEALDLIVEAVERYWCNDEREPERKPSQIRTSLVNLEKALCEFQVAFDGLDVETLLALHERVPEVAPNILDPSAFRVFSQQRAALLVAMKQHRKSLPKGDKEGAKPLIARDDLIFSLDRIFRVYEHERHRGKRDLASRRDPFVREILKAVGVDAPRDISKRIDLVNARRAQELKKKNQ